VTALLMSFEVVVSGKATRGLRTVSYETLEWSGVCKDMFPERGQHRVDCKQSDPLTSFQIWF